MHKKCFVLILVLCAVFVLLAGCNQEKADSSPPVGKEGYVLDFQDEFDGNELDFTKWLPQYLPHGTTSDTAFMADYEVSDGSLKLQIDEDRTCFYDVENSQGFKVSGIQTYNKNGLHEKTAIGANVVPYEGYTTQYGYFEIRYKMPACGGGGHVAFWLIGTQADAREDGTGSLQTGEIDITETRFDAVNVHSPKVYNWTDEDLKDWMVQVPIDGNYVDEYHTYAMDWTPEYLAFYLDGVEIARTEQSPQYEMCMILSMYINDDPDASYWSGPSNDVYPKVWEIDYVRVYKKAEGYPTGVTKPTDPVVLPGEEGAIAVKSEIVRNPSAPNAYFDVASAATLTYSDEPALNSRPEAINSTNPVCGDGYASTSEPNFPQEFTFMWDSPQTVDTMKLFVHYALGQAPNIVEIQTLKEGGQWEKAANFTIKWKTEMEAIECATLEFPNGEDIIGLKLIVHNANLRWNMYVINKIHLYNSKEEMPEIIPVESQFMTEAPDVGNLEPFAKLTYSHGYTEGSRPETVNDGNVPGIDGFASIAGDPLPQELTFTWSTRQNVDTVDLFVNYALGQAPTYVELQIRKSGGEWQSKGLYHITWQEESEKLEYARLAVPDGDGIVGLKLVVRAANMSWGNYVINKVQIYKEGVDAPDPNAPYGAAVSNFGAAPDGLKNLALSAAVTVSPNMQNAHHPDDAANDVSRLNDGLINDDSYARYCDGTQCQNDYIQYVWEKPVNVSQVVLFNQYSGQAPKAWKILVTTDGETWKQVTYTGNVQWAEEAKQGKVLKFTEQEGVLGLRIQITDANVGWGHYTIYEASVYGNEVKDPNEPEIPVSSVTNFTEAPAGLENLAPAAQIALSEAMQNVAKPNDGASDFNRIHDGLVNDDSYARYCDGTQCKQDWIDFMWETPVSPEQVVLFNQYSGQAPTAWTVFATADGENWTPVMATENVQWAAEAAEGKVLTFQEQEGILGLRLQITDANVDWGHYTIYEVAVYGTMDAVEEPEPSEPEETEPTEPEETEPEQTEPESAVTDFVAAPEGTQNLALDATASAEVNATLGNSAAQLNEGDRTWALSRPASSLQGQTDYYYLTWNQPVNISQVVLFNQYSGQAPTAWKVAVTTDGQTWNEVAAAENVQWSEGDLQGKVLTFPEQKNVIGLRLQIVDANLIWGAYTIYELETYGTVAEIPDVPVQPEDAVLSDFTEAPEGTQNVALSASASAAVNVTLGNTAAQLNEGDRTWSLSRAASTLEGQTDYYYLSWSESVNIQQVVLFNQYSGQAPTAWKIAVTTDGSTWNEIAAAEAVQWSESDLEGKALTFPEQKNIKGLRLQIVDANLIWGAYTIYELEVYGSNSVLQNLAIGASVTASEGVIASGAAIAQVNEGDRTWSMGRTASTMEGTDDYYQFSWDAPVSVEKVVLYNQYSGQAPTAWKVLVTTDGETWNEVASIENVQWTESDLEGKELTFAKQENVVGLRVQIVDANLDWGHYCIYEIEIY